MIVLNTQVIYRSNIPVEVVALFKAWFHEMMSGSWKSLQELKSFYPMCELHNKKVLFYIAGRAYILVTRINFESKVVMILDIKSNG